MRITYHIKNALQTIRLLYTVSKTNRVQKRFIKDNIEAELNFSIEKNDNPHEENTINKLTGGKDQAITAVLGEALCALLGEKMTAKERLLLTAQGNMMTLFTDFFDKKGISDEEVKECIEWPERIQGNTPGERSFLHFYKIVLANAPDPQILKTQLYKVYFARILSKKGSGYEEIKDITLRKGAESLLFYRSAFSTPLKRGEEKMLYSLGALIQLSHDIFDVYADQQNGMHTLLTTTKKIKEIRVLFLSLLNISYESAYHTKYNPDNIKDFLDLISIGIFSPGLVCLDKMQKIEKRSKNIFSPSQYRRKDLVFDMDAAVNKWRVVKYHLGMGTRTKTQNR